MTRKRQRLDSVVVPPTSARAWVPEAIGEFRLHTRLVSATRVVAAKVQAASSPGDLLASEGQRPALLTSTLEMVSAHKM